MNGKTCIVTGANSGLGLVTARELAARGARVVLVSRNAEKGAEAAAQIRSATGSEQVHLEHTDFASLTQTRDLAARLNERGSIDVLVNNAGLMVTERTLTEDGFESTFAVNHLAPFLLTNLLLPALEASGAGRVVTVASRAHKRAALDWDDLQSEQRFDGWRTYCRSKLCNVLFNQELARRLDGRPVTANCLHPGVVASGFGRENRGFWKLAVGLLRFVAVDAEKGAETQIHLATSPDLAGVSGRYFADCKEIPTSPDGANPELARRLWDESAAMTGLGEAA